MDFSNFYQNYAGSTRGALHVVSRLDINAFPVARGEVTPKLPIVFDQYMGKNPRDVIATGEFIFILFSDRLIEILTNESLTGWATFPIEICLRDGSLLPGYHGFAVTGRSGPIDNSKSQPAIIPPGVPGGKSHKGWIGLYFEPDTWDGSDFFFPEDRGGFFVTQRVVDIFKRYKIKNIEFERITETENMARLYL